MKSDVSIDVKAAIEKNSQVTSVADLEKRGKRQVKVIKTSLIYDLIQQAVRNVQRTQGSSLDADEQRKLVEKSKEEFGRLLSEQQGQKKQLQELQSGIQKYQKLVAELNQQIAAHADDLKGEADRARNLDAENGRYRAQVVELSAQLESIEKSQSKEAEDLVALRGKIGGLEEALKVARQVAEDREQQIHTVEDTTRKESEDYRLQVASLTAELKAVRESQPNAEEMLSELKQMREEFRAMEAHNRELEVTAARAEAAPSAALLEQILEKKMSQITTELSQKFAGMQKGGTGGTSPEDIKLTIKQLFSAELDREIESNIGDIKVKETKSGGIGANLERLKNLGLSSDGD